MNEADGESVADDEHTLDDYLGALVLAAPRLPARPEAVRRVVFGAARLPGEIDLTILALDELVELGRADRDLDGRYKAREAAPTACDPDWSERLDAVEAACRTEPDEPDDDLPDVPSDPPPGPGDILDPDVPQPEDTAECAAERPPAYSCWHDSPHGDKRDEPCEFDDEPASSHCAGCVCLPKASTDDVPDLPDLPDDAPSPAEILDHDMISPEDLAECSTEAAGTGGAATLSAPREDPRVDWDRWVEECGRQFREALAPLARWCAAMESSPTSLSDIAARPRHCPDSPALRSVATHRPEIEAELAQVDEQARAAAKTYRKLREHRRRLRRVLRATEGVT